MLLYYYIYFLICIYTVFQFFVCFLDCTSKALLTFFDCRGLAYSCVIIEYLEVFLDDVYEHSYHHFYNNRINYLMRKRFSVKYTTMMKNSFLRQLVDHQLIELLMTTLKLSVPLTPLPTAAQPSPPDANASFCMFVRDAEGNSRLVMGKYQVLHLILQWLVLIKINRVLITPIRPTVYHYYCRAEYIKSAEPSFIPFKSIIIIL